MTASPCETIVVALANIYTMMTQHRGLVPNEDVRLLFGKWQHIQRLDRATFSQVCEKIYRLGLMRKDNKTKSSQLNAQFEANKHDPVWLALNARNLVFVQSDQHPPLHRGISYCMVTVVLTARSGEDSLYKLGQSQAQMDSAVASLIAGGYAVTSARAVRLMYGKAGKNSLPTLAKTEHVSVEYWFTSELQANPLEHVTVPEHLVYAEMSPEAKARLPISTQKAARGDPTRLDRIRTYDVVARWNSYVPGQVICIKRRQLFEGGESYHLRYVV